MAVNVRGTMLCYKHAAKQMIAQERGGRIIGTYAQTRDVRARALAMLTWAWHPYWQAHVLWPASKVRQPP
jgi:NAD(P)-dependent dehydrogenase (short-subunit alcohol dehydrogenase family)